MTRRLFAYATTFLHPATVGALTSSWFCTARRPSVLAYEVSSRRFSSQTTIFSVRRESSNEGKKSAISSMSASRKKSPRKKACIPLYTDDELARAVAKGRRIVDALSKVYPEAPEGFLDHRNTFTLLVAVVLSAQTTDLKVNAVTPALFDLANCPKDMADLGEKKVLELIRTVGLAPQKARAIIGLSNKILTDYNGNVPDTFEELESLPGVGHKTASVVMMQAFRKPAFPVDTHIHRLACRWGCGDAKSVEKTEALLKLWFPDQTSWGQLHIRIILFGREHCPAINHDMDACPVCSFAATDEARRLNLSSPRKFIAPQTVRDCFAIREVVRETSITNDGSQSVSKRAKLTNVRKEPGRKKHQSRVNKPRTVSKRQRTGVSVDEDADVPAHEASDEVFEDHGRRKGLRTAVRRENERELLSDAKDSVDKQSGLNRRTADLAVGESRKVSNTAEADEVVVETKRYLLRRRKT